MAKKKTTKVKSVAKKSKKKKPSAAVKKKSTKTKRKPKVKVKKKTTAKKTGKKKTKTTKKSPVKPAAVKAAPPPTKPKPRIPEGATAIKLKRVVTVKKTTKRVRGAADQTAEAAEQQPLSIEQLKKVKTSLTKKDLLSFRQLLLQKRAEILGDVEAMETDARGKNEGGNLSNMPVHMADIGSDNYEQEFTLGLVESERKLLREIDEALQRMFDGIYGVCMETGTPINLARLEAKPWAKYCIEVARERERRRQY